MTDPRQSRPDVENADPDEQQLTERRPGGSDDLGGPASTLGAGVEQALTGEQATEDDQGSASTSPQPRG
ncbi:MAG TPA: hypothetical protein VF557_09520 [Jatrophihabitans sp.]|jgi:hypothetical protein|uniref:hypothetical protein n=1 Tax=Jatrophihabitans sp. TaxID=1932789 RepID=UPI002EF567E6